MTHEFASILFSGLVLSASVVPASAVVYDYGSWTNQGPISTEVGPDTGMLKVGASSQRYLREAGFFDTIYFDLGAAGAADVTFSLPISLGAGSQSYEIPGGGDLAYSEGSVWGSFMIADVTGAPDPFTQDPDGFGPGGLTPNLAQSDYPDDAANAWAMVRSSGGINADYGEGGGTGLPPSGLGGDDEFVTHWGRGQSVYYSNRSLSGTFHVQSGHIYALMYSLEGYEWSFLGASVFYDGTLGPLNFESDSAFDLFSASGAIPGSTRFTRPTPGIVPVPATAGLLAGGFFLLGVVGLWRRPARA